MIRKGFFKATINLKCATCGRRGDLITNDPADLALVLRSWRWVLSTRQTICDRCSVSPHINPTIRQQMEIPSRPVPKVN